MAAIPYRLKPVELLPQIKHKKEYVSAIESQVVRDVKDRHVLAAAINSNCKFIVTGDKDLKTLKNYKGIEITTSRKLLEITKN